MGICHVNKLVVGSKNTEKGSIQIYGKDAPALILGDPTHEGGDISIYRDTSGNKQLFVDADAASNAIGMSVYAGVVAQNYLTVGQAALNTAYNLYIAGSCHFTSTFSTPSIVYASEYRPYTYGAASFLIDINIPAADAATHQIRMQVDETDVFLVQATGDGAGGIVGKRIVVIGGQCHSRTAVGAADYNPSVITSDYIIAMTDTAAARAVIISTEDRNTGTTTKPRVFIIKDESGNAAVNNITISLETAGNIDGAATKVINTNYGSVTLYLDGTNGWTIPN